MIFERPILLYVVPVIIAIIALAAFRSRRARERAADVWSRALGVRARALGRYSVWIVSLVALCIAVGIAGPRWGSATTSTESQALNVVVVMDISRSMLAQDVAPSRLGRAVSLSRRLVQDLDGDRFALVAFAGHPYVLSPLTLDASSITLQLDALDPEMASVGGSGLGPALELARKVLTASPQGGDRAIVVFTDGETFDGPHPLETAGAGLRRAGITLIAVPVGDIRGARIPDPDGSWHRDQIGREVVTVRRDDLLQAAVQSANGVMIAANAPDPVGDVRRVLAHLHRIRTSDRSAADLVPRAWIFALVAALVLLAHTLTRRSAALIGIMLAIGVARAGAQRPSTGSRLLLRGDTMRARQAFTAEIKRRQTDSAWFNAGTSALMARDLPTAIAELQRATMSVDPALRQRALYNLGTAYLLSARRDSTQRDSLLNAASTQLQQALLLAPNDRNAKFNFELARRMKPPPKPSSSSKGKSGGTGNRPPPPPPPSGGGRSGMTPAEADQVLNAMERAERDTRQNQNQRMRRGEPQLGPDW
ncbi:MAG TPA: VWA domain-containing protein [Gemmatimonadales bacterium]|jgi:Ca-activated chloride channel family protein